MRTMLIAAALLLVACSGDVPTETADAVFGVGNAAPLVISNFAVDQSSASYLGSIEPTAVLQVNSLRKHEIVWVRLKIGGIEAFRDGRTCADMGRSTPCEFDHVGVCTLVSNGGSVAWYGLRIDGEGSHTVSMPGLAGDLCTPFYPDPVAGDYKLIVQAEIWNLQNQKKRGLVRSSIDFTLVD